MVTNRFAHSLIWLIAALHFSSLGNLAVNAEEKPPQPVTVKKVLSAKLVAEKGSLTVTAVGEVPTGGYTKPTLTRVQYSSSPTTAFRTTRWKPCRRRASSRKSSPKSPRPILGPRFQVGSKACGFTAWGMGRW